MKRLIAVAALCTALLCLFAGCSMQGEQETASVESVAVITGLGSAGAVDRYAGKVVSGQSAEIKKDSDKTVS